MQGGQIWSLVGELRSHMLHVMAKKKKIPPPQCVSKSDTTKKVSLFYGFTHT